MASGSQQTKIEAYQALGYELAWWIRGAAVMVRHGEHVSGVLVLPDGASTVLQTVDTQKLLNREVINMAKYTKAQLEGMTSKELVDIYNAAVEKDKQVKKFRDKDTAVERVLGAQPKGKTRGKASPGYKGHRGGSRKEQAHIWFDKNVDCTRSDFAAFAESLGLKGATASSWFYTFKSAG